MELAGQCQFEQPAVIRGELAPYIAEDMCITEANRGSGRQCQFEQLAIIRGKLALYTVEDMSVKEESRGQTHVNLHN